MAQDKFCLEAHGYIDSDDDNDDSGPNSFDENYTKIKLKPTPYKYIKDKIIIINNGRWPAKIKDNKNYSKLNNIYENSAFKSRKLKNNTEQYDSSHLNNFPFTSQDQSSEETKPGCSVQSSTNNNTNSNSLKEMILPQKQSDNLLQYRTNHTMNFGSIPEIHSSNMSSKNKNHVSKQISSFTDRPESEMTETDQRKQINKSGVNNKDNIKQPNPPVIVTQKSSTVQPQNPVPYRSYSGVCRSTINNNLPESVQQLYHQNRPIVVTNNSENIVVLISNLNSDQSVHQQNYQENSLSRQNDENGVCCPCTMF